MNRIHFKKFIASLQARADAQEWYEAWKHLDHFSEVSKLCFYTHKQTHLIL